MLPYLCFKTQKTRGKDKDLILPLEVNGREEKRSREKSMPTVGIFGSAFLGRLREAEVGASDRVVPSCFDLEFGVWKAGRGAVIEAKTRE